MPILAILITVLIFYLFKKEKSPLDYEGDSYETYKKYCVPQSKVYIVTEGEFKNNVLSESELKEVKLLLRSEYEKYIQELTLMRDGGKLSENDYNYFLDNALDDMLKYTENDTATGPRNQIEN